MSTLRISLFGSMQIQHPEYPSEVKASRTVQALLAYLLLCRQRSYPREVLAGLFWGDHPQDQARNCLSTALWRLRGVLEPQGTLRGAYLIITPPGEVSFNWASDHWLDVSVFETQLGSLVARPSGGRAATDIQALRAVLQLYSGDLLAGFYDEWALRERERLRVLYLSGLRCLMDIYQRQGAYEESIACGQQVLHADPLREDIHQRLIRLYLESGQRALAVRQYETCRTLLATELGVAPLDETQALYNQILAGYEYGRPAAPATEAPLSLQDAIWQVRTAVWSIDQSRAQLERAVQLLEQVSGQRL